MRRVSASWLRLSRFSRFRSLCRLVELWTGGERGILALGAAILSVTTVVLAFVTGFAVLVVGSALVGLGQMLTMVACQTLIANDRDESRRDRGFAHFTVATSVAQFGAPAIGGLLIVESAGGARNWVPSYGALVLAGLIGLGFSWSLLVRPGELTARPQHFGKAVPGALREVMRSRTVLVGLSVGFASLSAIDLLTAFMPAFGESRGIPPHTVGFLIAAYGIASIAARLVLQRLILALGRRKLLISCLLCAAASLRLRRSRVRSRFSWVSWRSAGRPWACANRSPSRGLPAASARRSVEPR
ncbi:MFS transporter [Tsukamurella sp. PLM1]|uniref:MFS transporter n=1 Tax=Tsukamurella sp. PLM1 TaxID=2929795 RepID=UPI00205695AB|nr:MFS transporter [Tsukamurella sp. PLM1]BDH56546.1 hypothetical protein MTP03_14850 [Tsukamurella sp. PLM1]